MAKSMQLFTILMIFLLVTSFSRAAENDKTPIPLEKEKAEAKSPFDHSHAGWTKVLKNFVIVEGPKSEVNYKALKLSPELLNNYLHDLANVSKEDFGTWSEKEKLSFWINAYNAYTIKLVIDNYPVSSIKDIGGFFSSPWKKEFFTLLGEDMHLDRIEHDIVRKKFDEPRIHFALNCASIGCPALRSEAYMAGHLDKQLDEQTKTFLNDESRNRIDHEKRKLILSEIFDWFDDDFEKNGSTVKKFVVPYMVTDEAERAKVMEYSVKHIDYNWKLNEVE